MTVAFWSSLCSPFLADNDWPATELVPVNSSVEGVPDGSQEEKSPMLSGQSAQLCLGGAAWRCER